MRLGYKAVNVGQSTTPPISGCSSATKILVSGVDHFVSTCCDGPPLQLELDDDAADVMVQEEGFFRNLVWPPTEAPEYRYEVLASKFASLGLFVVPTFGPHHFDFNRMSVSLPMPTHKINHFVRTVGRESKLLSIYNNIAYMSANQDCTCLVDRVPLYYMFPVCYTHQPTAFQNDKLRHIKNSRARSGK